MLENGLTFVLIMMGVIFFVSKKKMVLLPEQEEKTNSKSLPGKIRNSTFHPLRGIFPKIDKSKNLSIFSKKQNSIQD